MGRHPDVLVVGGGVIGLTCAYTLAGAGLRVELIDRGPLGREASWAGAGIIPPGEFPNLTTTPLDALRAYTAFRFWRLSDELYQATGIDNEFDLTGGVEYLGPDEQWATDLWRNELIRFKACGRREDGSNAYRLLELGQVRNPRHLAALVAACQSRGVTLRPDTPFGWWQTDRRPSAVLADGTAVPAGHTLVAAGAWADQVLSGLGMRLAVRPVRGQMVLFNPGRALAREVLIRGKRYVVPRRDGRILVGSTEEPEAGFEKANTPAAVSELTAFAFELMPELRGAAVEATWAGLRPGSADGLPTIGRLDGRDGVLVAAGHFRAGIQTSIGTADCVRALVLGEPPPLPLEPFAVGRVPHPPMRTAFRS